MRHQLEPRLTRRRLRLLGAAADLPGPGRRCRPRPSPRQPPHRHSATAPIALPASWSDTGPLASAGGLFAFGNGVCATVEEFLAHVIAWKDQSQARIIDQIKRLGASCDWSRLAFTMDEPRNRAVRTMFKKMFDDGLIYRGDYLVKGVWLAHHAGLAARRGRGGEGWLRYLRSDQ